MPVTPERRSSALLRSGRAHACTTFAPQGVQANAKTPTVQEWNFTVEQQLNPKHRAARGLCRIVRLSRAAQRRPEHDSRPDLRIGSGCTAGGAATSGTPATAANQSHVPQGAQYIPVGTRPNPYLGAGFFWYTEGNSSYNALQAELVHRLSRGLQFRANYTWSKNLDMNSGLTGAQAQNQAQMIMDRNDLRRDWGPSALNVTSQASISGRYELPFGKGQRWLTTANGAESKLVGGWQLNGIATLLSGFPFTPVIGSNRSGDGDTRNPDRPSSEPGVQRPRRAWAIRTSGSIPTPSSLPAGRHVRQSGARNVFSGPGLADLDVSLFKDTAISERTTLQFRAEFFNVLNHANFGTPNATVFSSGAVNASAGLITTLATPPRQIQFGLKLIF